MATVDSDTCTQTTVPATVAEPTHDSRDVFSGRIAIVTGAAAGIGRAVAEELGRRGARLVIADLNAQGVESVAVQLRDQQVDAVAVAADVSEASGIEDIVESTLSRHGRIDLLFNVAGIGWGGAFETMCYREIDRVLSINLGSVLKVTSAVYPIMVRQRAGHIINMSSGDGLIPKPLQAAYCATKHAIVAFSRSLSVEAQAHGVRVSVACPGLVETQIAKTSAAILGRKLPRSRNSKPGNKMTAQRCAQLLLRGVARGQETILIGVFRPSGWIYRCSPSLFRRLTAPLFLRKMGHPQSSWLSGTYSSSVRWMIRLIRTGRIR